MKYLLIFLTIILFSCSHENNKESYIIDAAIDFYVLDSNGNDLLDPSNPDALNLDDVRVFEVVNGEEVEVYNPNYDAPHGFMHLEPEGIYDKYMLRLFLNITEKSNPTTTIVRWSDTDEDVFKAEIDRGRNHIVCTKIWLNGKFVWPTSYSSGRPFIKIVK